jgi:hypothetical protein
MICQKCKKEFEEKEIHKHHIHPRFMNNKKGEGIKIYLCEKCHNILHLIIPKIIWECLNEKQKKDCINNVLNFTEKWKNG